MGYAQSRGNFGGPPMEFDARAATWLARHFNFQPVHTEIDAGSKSLGGCFFGREACGKAFGCVSLAHAVVFFALCEDAIDETASITGY